MTIPKLFASNAPLYEPSLVTKWDLVAFDEVAGPQFNKTEDKQIDKHYMELGSFSRGSAKGTIQGTASFVFNGNLDGDIETIARTSHLFLPFPDAVRNDMAFHDRWHAYLLGQEMPKMQPGYFTSHLGFIADYIAEIFHGELRSRNYADVYDHYLNLGSHIEERDARPQRRRLWSDQVATSQRRMQQATDRRISKLRGRARRRVKEQLHRMGGVEYSRANLSYIDKENRQETFVTCKELGATQLIPETPLPRGDVFTVGYNAGEGRYSLFRIQCSVAHGSGRWSVVGVTSKTIRESARMAYDYLRAKLQEDRAGPRSRRL